MATLSLKICIDTSQQVKTMQFEPGMMVFDACNFIRHKVQEANRGNRKDINIAAHRLTLAVSIVMLPCCVGEKRKCENVFENKF